MERRRGDGPHLLIERSPHVEDEVEVVGRRPAVDRLSHRGHVLGPLAVRDELGSRILHEHPRALLGLLLDSLRCGLGRFADRGLCRPTQCQAAGERRAALEEIPSIRSLRTHGSLLTL